MKTILFFFFCCLPLMSFADCYQEITLNNSFSSRVFKLLDEEVPEYDVFNENSALRVLNILLHKETSCSLKEIQINTNKTHCYHFPQSGNTCEVATDIGYFIIHRSSFGSFEHSIIYTRWD